MSKIILFIAVSEDGFIADINGGVDWLPHPENEQDLEAVGYTALLERIDTVLMGRNSYQQIIDFGDWAWMDKHTYVFSSRSLDSQHSCITITHESPDEFMLNIEKRQSGKDIWLLGGAELAQSFARQQLIDDIILTIVPHRLGEGISLGVDLDDFDLQNEQPLMDGMIQRTYVKKRPESI